MSAAGKVKVLMVQSAHQIKGGFEKYVQDIVKNIREEIEIEFVIHSDTPITPDMVFHGLRCKAYSAPIYKMYNYHSYRKWWETFLSENRYDLLHIYYLDSIYAYADIAKKYSIPIIAHSHNTTPPRTNLSYKIGQINKILSAKSCDFFLACSKKAGIDRFGKKNASNPRKFAIAKTGIDTKSFLFQENIRKAKRRELGISNKIVIGHIGRLCFQKNQEFCLEVFELFHKKNPDSVLVLIGSGENEGYLKKITQEKGLEECVLFLGNQADTAGLFMAMDVFLFPSRYEGFGIVLLEAQATGLPCIISEAIQPEANLELGLVHQCNLLNPYDEWVSEITNALTMYPENRAEYSIKVKSKGYDIKDTVAELSEFYGKCKLHTDNPMSAFN